MYVESLCCNIVLMNVTNMLRVKVRGKIYKPKSFSYHSGVLKTKIVLNVH